MEQSLFFLSDSSIQLHCLICSKSVPATFPTAKSSSNAEIIGNIFNDLFQNLCKYMEWPKDGKPTITSLYDFKNKKEPFPFCDNCRVTLVKLFDLNEQLEEIQKNIENVTVNISEKILGSQENGSNCYRGGSGDINFSRNDEQSIHEIHGEKSRFYRNEVFKRYNVQVNFQAIPEIPDRNNTPDIKTQVESDSEGQTSVPPNEPNLDNKETKGPPEKKNDEEESSTGDECEARIRKQRIANKYPRMSTPGGQNTPDKKYKLQSGQLVACKSYNVEKPHEEEKNDSTHHPNQLVTPNDYFGIKNNSDNDTNKINKFSQQQQCQKFILSSRYCPM